MLLSTYWFNLLNITFKIMCISKIVLESYNVKSHCGVRWVFFLFSLGAELKYFYYFI